MRPLCSLLLVSTTLMASGCGGGSDKGREEVYKVTGVVTMGGEPLQDAIVAFSPEGEQPTATGRSDEDGNITLTTYEYGDGAAAGKFKVKISKYDAAAAATAAESGGGGDHEVAEAAAGSHSSSASAGGDALVPPEYSSDATPFSAEVKPEGDNHFQFVIP